VGEVLRADDEFLGTDISTPVGCEQFFVDADVNPQNRPKEPV
jgi:hypothetical protein